MSERGVAMIRNVFHLNQKLATLIRDLENSNSKVKSKTHLIGNIETENIKSKTLLTLFLGIIMGFITGILLVFIRNFVKSYKESQA